LKLYGGIEAGGTKFVCIIGRNPDEIYQEERFPTTNPEETIKRAVDFFRPYQSSRELEAIGIASFGPVDLNKESPTYGFITSTPKPGWANVDLRGEIQRKLSVPVAFDTDVNAAAYGEKYWVQENHKLDPFIYVTIGTGIGVGVIINGSLLHGLVHTEAGHMAIPHDLEKDPFPGVCPFHGDCWEGLASGISMNERWKKQPQDLPDDHIAWELETDYTAFALVNLIYAYSPMRIILGGGVSQHPAFHTVVREKVLKINNGYVQSAAILEDINHFILPPALANRSGGLGAIAMAMHMDPESQISPTKAAK
jgi:fructokinase